MGKKVVELIERWADFEEQFPEASVEDFCRYHLLKTRTQEAERKKITAGIVPPRTDSLLSRLIGRLAMIFMTYARSGLAETELENHEGFGILNALRHMGESRKTEIINYNLIELSTGIDIINRLKKAGLLTEREDPTDKRGRLIKITEEGERILFQCYEKMAAVASIMYGEVPEDDKQLVIQLLQQSEIFHSKLAIQTKGKSIGEIEAIVQEERAKQN